MTNKKTDAPAPQPEDLTACKLPQGGVARFYTEPELSTRRANLLEAYQITLMPKMRRLAIASKIIDEKGNVLADNKALNGVPEGLTVEESKQLIEMGHVGAWVYLKAWSLRRAGEPLPLPADADDLIDNYPRDIVAALVSHAGKIIQAQGLGGDTFAPDGGIDNEDSPTTV